jgi:predicted P-loop ATPase
MLFGVVPTAYTSAVFRCTMIGAVARAYEPGCKLDTVLMLEGAQGKKKSSSLEPLRQRHVH